MKQPDVLYCIEHVGRELAIACAVKQIAKSKFDIEVEVISLPHHAEHAVKVYQPKLITVPAFLWRRGYGANAFLERLRGVPVFNLAIEQLFSDANRKFRMPKDAVARNSTPSDASNCTRGAAVG